MPPSRLSLFTPLPLHRHSTDPVRQRDPLIEAERDKNNKQKKNNNNKNVTCDSYDD